MECQVWIISMSERTEIENLVLSQFSGLVAHGFSEPLVKREDWFTVIDWLGDRIAIEVELDWRNFDVFVLIVRLENGKLPGGYYMKDGRLLRIHLEEVIRKKLSEECQDKEKLFRKRRKQEKPNKGSVDSLKDRITVYKVVLMSCIDQIVEEKSLF